MGEVTKIFTSPSLDDHVTFISPCTMYTVIAKAPHLAFHVIAALLQTAQEHPLGLPTTV